MSGASGSDGRGRGRSRGRGRGSGGGGGDNLCYYCKKSGHRKADCPELRRDTTPTQSPRKPSFSSRYSDISGGDVSEKFSSLKIASGGVSPGKCFNCGESGHKKYDCPLNRGDRRQERVQRPSQSYSASTSAAPQEYASEQRIDVKPVFISLEDLKLKAQPSFVKRPDFGKRGRLIELIANHFRMVIENVVIYKYRIDITPIRGRARPQSAARGDTSEAKVRKLKQKEVRDVFDCFTRNTPELFGEGLRYPVYDGDCIMITANELWQRRYEKTIELEEYRSKYKISVQFTEEIDLNSINQYYDGMTTEVPRNAIQAIEIILKHGPTTNRIPIGNSLYPKDNEYRRKEFIDRQGVKQVVFGHYQSMHLSQVGPTLIVDRSATAFYINGRLIDFVNKISRNLFRDTRKLTNQLKGLRVYTTHLPYKRSYTIKEIHNKAPNEIFFDLDEENGNKRKISVKQYYKEKYKKDLNANYPCIIPSGGRNNFLPLELCELFPDQPVSRGALTAENTTNMVRKCGTQPPIERFDEIYGAVNNIINDSENYLLEFSIKVDRNPLRIPGRIIDKPMMEPEMRNQIRKLYQPIDLKNWIVVNLSEETKNKYKDFVRTLGTTAVKVGMNISQPFIYWNYNPYDSEDIDDLIKTIFRGAFEESREKNRILQMILFIIPFDPDLPVRNIIKFYGDIHHGIATQCIKSVNVVREPRGIHNNLLLKINAKLGGINSIIKDLPDKPAILKKRVMIIGADVTHPAPGSKLVSSVAACVASYDKEHCYYAASIKIQERSSRVMQSSSRTGQESSTQRAQEMIKCFDEMIKELLLIYRKKNNYLPDHIIYYRDGVSESQFIQVLEFEYGKLLKACNELNIKPKVTIITVQKRHHTRFRPFKSENGDKKGNILPGTTVDTHVTHPADFDFFLNSHNGIQGTNRPTHYYVLHDDHHFSADDLQKLTYYLCYTYARCDNPISIPSPVQYAHLAAYRARDHIVACNENVERRTRDESDDARRRRESEIAVRLNRKIKVNEALKNCMYYC